MGDRPCAVEQIFFVKVMFFRIRMTEDPGVESIRRDTGAKRHVNGSILR